MSRVHQIKAVKEILGKRSEKAKAKDKWEKASPREKRNILTRRNPNMACKRQRWSSDEFNESWDKTFRGKCVECEHYSSVCARCYAPGGESQCVKT